MRKAFNSVFGKSAGLAVSAFIALCPAAAMASGGAHFGGGAVGHFSGGGGHFVDRGFRSGYRGGYYRGGVYLGIGGYPNGYADGPDYGYAPAYGPAPQPCAPVYDSYGNQIQNPACYAAPPQQQYAPQQYAPQQEQQYYGQ
jgi:hypothetical protein